MVPTAELAVSPSASNMSSNEENSLKDEVQLEQMDAENGNGLENGDNHADCQSPNGQEESDENEDNEVLTIDESFARTSSTDEQSPENELLNDAQLNGNTVKRKPNDDDDDDDDSADIGDAAPPLPKQPRLEDSPAISDPKPCSPVPEDPITAPGQSKKDEDSAKASASSKDADKKDVKKDEEKKEPELTNSEALLNKIVEYVDEALESGTNVQRKILDALLGAINVQVQREPLSVRRLILDKQLVLPNTISFPPSQAVEVLIEHDPDIPLSKVITKLFSDERVKLAENERKERAQLKQHFGAPHMTRLLAEIGQELVQEATYYDIVHAKNLPEAPKNLDTYKQVAAQLKPVWESLRKKNEPFKGRLFTCQVCGFKTESRIVIAEHRSLLHHDGRKFQCAFCPETDTNEARIVKHYADDHEIVAVKMEPPLRNPCLICDEDFQFKGQRDTHMRSQCKRDFQRIRYIMTPRSKEDVCAVNSWLWEKPPVDPTILAQQQQNQREQQAAKQRQQQQALLAAQQVRQSQQQKLMIIQQQQQAQLLVAQKRMFAQQQALMAAAKLQAPLQNNNQHLIAAMQRHLAQAQQNRNTSLATAASAFQRQSARATQSKPGPKAAASANNAFVAQLAAFNRNQPSSSTPAVNSQCCEICDQTVGDRERYLTHLQVFHKQMRCKSATDMQQGAPLACSRCKERFWTYEGLERHLVMEHGLVTQDLLQKAQRRQDGGRCKRCSKQYAFNMLQHLVAEHHVKLCSAEIMYSCDVCSFKCQSYSALEEHLNNKHPKNGEASKQTARDAEVVTLD